MISRRTYFTTVRIATFVLHRLTRLLRDTDGAPSLPCLVIKIKTRRTPEESVRRAMPARMNFISFAPGKSFAAILVRVADAVEPLGLVARQDGLPLAFLGRRRKGLGQLADLFQPLAEGGVTGLQHNQRAFTAPATDAFSRR